MGKKATASKNKWNAAHYERINLTVPIGKRDDYKALAEHLEMSVNQLFVTAVQEYAENHDLDSFLKQNK